ncbi:hypothetical protein Ahy_A06g027285 [Arachis hypogaea]|uniref:Uncharacterized protein n=1 Tax=Arachis hypogaea TaxID=3818 RepID=A0A445CN84_ARAHY|nr:hypothetical protein Ahy_A06g027285 [Arachis hypogaea]
MWNQALLPLRLSTLTIFYHSSSSLTFTVRRELSSDDRSTKAQEHKSNDELEFSEGKPSGIYSLFRKCCNYWNGTQLICILSDIEANMIDTNWNLFTLMYKRHGNDISELRMKMEEDKRNVAPKLSKAAHNLSIFFFTEFCTYLVVNELLKLQGENFSVWLIILLPDGYQLAWELDNAWEQSIKSGSKIDINLEFLSKYRIPHPGRVGGRFFIQKMMPMMLSWVLGGNSSKLEGRPVCCRLSDKANDQLHTWFVEDDALERTINGEYNMFSQKEDYPGISIAKPLPEASFRVKVISSTPRASQNEGAPIYQQV